MGPVKPDPHEQYADELAALDEIARALGAPVTYDWTRHPRVRVTFGPLTFDAFAIPPDDECDDSCPREGHEYERPPVADRVAALATEARELTAELDAMPDDARAAAFAKAFPDAYAKAYPTCPTTGRPADTDEIGDDEGPVTFRCCGGLYPHHTKPDRYQEIAVVPDRDDS